MSYKKKLIEVALPLEAINKEAAREKSIRHGHPSTLHLWWARRPLAAARAVIWASLVDDPSSLPEQFPTEEAQNAERERLFKILTELVKLENSNNQEILDAAKAEIIKSTDNNPPPLLDPFAGGGAIPLEAQRLGLEAHASDLNPVAVMINKAMIEIPPKFANQPPVNPEAKANPVQKEWIGAQGLAEDVRYYGEWMKEKAYEKIGHLYPKVKDKNGREYTVIAWIWARTVKSPNPLAGGAHVPLVSSFMLSKKKGFKAWVEIVKDSSADDDWRFEVKTGDLSKSEEDAKMLGTKVGKAKDFICCLTNTPIQRSYVQTEGKSDRLSERLMAIVALGDNGRVYLSPDKSHEDIAKKDIDSSEVSDIKENVLSGSTPTRAMITGGVCSAYGLRTWGHLFSDRQLMALTTFVELIPKMHEQIIADGGSIEYAQATGVYLAFVIDKMADLGNALNRWEPNAQCPRQLFARQAISMVWDFAESNPFSKSSGSWSVLINNLMNSLHSGLFDFPRNVKGFVNQADAQTNSRDTNYLVSTDPPYYDNIAYAILSDFFYVWLRQSLKESFPDIFNTLLTPKTEELVVSPYRFSGGINEARSYFEEGMFRAFKQIYISAQDAYPVSVYYGYKQKETDRDDNEVSTGWEAILSAILQARFSIVGTWPMRTEMGSRAVGQDANALASSIVLVCRKRSIDATSINRRQFTGELREALKRDLHILLGNNISPVDLPQACIGPGMAVYSRYSEVLEANGEQMSIRDALILINQELDGFLSAQVGRMDKDSRFCIAWYEEFGLTVGKFGDAETMSKPMLANLQELVDDGVLESGQGRVRLKRRDELPEKWNSASENTVWTMVQQLSRCFEINGLDKTAEHMINLSAFDSSRLENVKALAYRAFIAAERKGWTDDAFVYNSLIAAWPDLTERMTKLKEEKPEQMQMFDI